MSLRVRGVGLVDLGDDVRHGLAERAARRGPGRARPSRTAGPRRAARGRRRRARRRSGPRAPRTHRSSARSPSSASPNSDGYAAAKCSNSAAWEVSKVVRSPAIRPHQAARSRQWPPTGVRYTPPVRIRSTGGTFSISGVTPSAEARGGVEGEVVGDRLLVERAVVAVLLRRHRDEQVDRQHGRADPARRSGRTPRSRAWPRRRAGRRARTRRSARRPGTPRSGRRRRRPPRGRPRWRPPAPRASRRAGARGRAPVRASRRPTGGRRPGRPQERPSAAGWRRSHST